MVPPPRSALTDPTTPPGPDPSPATSSSGVGAQTLSRDLSAFLVEFSIAIHKNQMYPPGHPHLTTALIGFHDRVHALLASRSTLSIGVARKQLIIEGVATDPENPLLRELALKLHRHQLGAVKFMPDVQDHETAEFLALLVVDPYLSRNPLGRPTDGGDLRRWENIWLFPLAYDQLELIEDDGTEGPDGGGNAADRGRGTQLWVGLASAALAGEKDAPTPGAADPAEVARAIEDHGRETTYDQVIVGYLLQIADELKGEADPANSALNRRISRLVGSLNPETLKRLLEMGGDTGQRRRFVLDATQGMAINAVMDLVKAAAETSNQSMSTSMVRLLNKLAVHAEGGTIEAREGADRELREHVRRLVGGWELDDPNPHGYTEILEGMSRHKPEGAPTMPDQPPEPSRLLQMAIEVDVVGDTVIRSTDAMLAEGKCGELLDILEKAPRRNEAATILLDYVVTPERLKLQLADESAVDFELVDRLTQRLGAGAAEPLLDAYAGAESRTVRRKLHDRISAIGFGVGEKVVERLTGTPWFVQRNMLTLLAAMPTWPKGFDPAPWAAHDDARVRREAYRLLFRSDERRYSALGEALADDDEGIQRLAMAVATEGCPPALATVLERIATDQGREPEVRALAFRAVATLKRPETVPMLVAAAVEKGGFLRRGRLREKGPELLAALASLANHFPEDDEAKAVVELAEKSDDAQVRAAIRRRGAKR